MMTIKEFGKILRKDETVRNEYLLAEKEGNIDCFFREHDVDATAESIKKLYEENKGSELDDSELDTVSGGVNDDSTCHTASTVNYSGIGTASTGIGTTSTGTGTCHTASVVGNTSSAPDKKPFFWWLLW